MRLTVIITLSLYLFQPSSEKPFFLNWFGRTEPRRSSNNISVIIQDLTDPRITKIPERSTNCDKFKKTSRNRIRTTTTTATTTTTPKIPKIRTKNKPRNIIFESNEDIDFSVCHPENNQACVLDQVYSCTTSKECDESGKCERKTVCGIKFLSKNKV